MIPFLIFLSAVADRVRGDRIRIWYFDSNHRLPAYIFLGWTFAALSGHVLDWLTLPIMLAIIAGASPGLSQPMGALLNGGTDQGEPERWQVGMLKTNALLACIVRGVMWGLPVSLLAYFDHRLIWALPAYAIAFPGAILVARYLLKSDWEKAEFLRGGIAASLFILFGMM
ncbi:MAG: hypothetical protein ACYCZJ_13155 [Sulfuriferula sp.]